MQYRLGRSLLLRGFRHTRLAPLPWRTSQDLMSPIEEYSSSTVYRASRSSARPLLEADQPGRMSRYSSRAPGGMHTAGRGGRSVFPSHTRTSGSGVTKVSTRIIGKPRPRTPRKAQYDPLLCVADLSHAGATRQRASTPMMLNSSLRRMSAVRQSAGFCAGHSKVLAGVRVWIAVLRSRTGYASSLMEFAN